MKKTFILTLMVLMIFLVGCSQKSATPTAGKAFVGGTQGLAISFLPNEPPANVFDSDFPFTIGVRLENKGEYSIDNPQVVDASVTGINPADFRVSSADLMKHPSDSLKGTRIDTQGNIVAGDVSTIDFPQMQYFTSVSGSTPFTVRANVCYDYGTKAQGKLCVRKDLRGVSGEAGICNPDRTVPAENSGAPVQITNFRQNVAGSNKIDFFFTITKTGSAADSLFKNSIKCDTALPNRDVVYVDVTDTGLGDLTCSGFKDGANTRSGYITLFNGQREVRCTQTINNPDDFEKIIEINLKYGYKQYVDTQLIVKHAS